MYVLVHVLMSANKMTVTYDVHFYAVYMLRVKTNFCILMVRAKELPSTALKIMPCMTCVFPTLDSMLLFLATTCAYKIKPAFHQHFHSTCISLLNIFLPTNK